MSETASHTVVLLGGETCLDLADFARACGAPAAYVEQLIIEGVLVPRAGADGFGGDDIARVRRVMRLQRDFDATPASVAVMLDLLEEIDRLRAQLRRAGLEPD